MINNLAGLKNRINEREEAIADANRPKATWFKIAEGERVVVKFLQELDENAPKYNPAFGTFLGAVEHQAPGPKGYLSRALDTRELEGKDFCQELYMSDREKYKDLRPRENFYINVAVETPNGVEAQIMSRSLHSPVVQDLIELYEDDLEDGITGVPIQITRRGTGATTTWKLKVLGEEADFDVSGVEPWDLEKTAVRHVTYDKQREFYQRNSDIELGGSGSTSRPQIQEESPFNSPQNDDDDGLGW